MAFALALILGIRAWLYWQYGALSWPDTPTYVGTAESLLTTNDWFAPGLITFRAIGYPFFLACAQVLAGVAWPQAIIGLQVSMSVICFYALFRLGAAFGLRSGWAILAATLYLISHITLYDLSILTDSLFSHLFVIALSVLLVPLLEQRRISWWRALAAGGLFAIATVIREATIYLLPITVISTAFLALGGRIAWRQTITAGILFIIPAVMTWQGYLAWNEARTGYRFITTVGKYVYLMHPLELEYRDIKVLRDPLLREAFEATSSHYTYGHTRAIDAYLSSHHGINEYVRLRMAQDAFWTAWREAPLGMATEALKELRPKHALQLFSPSMAARDIPSILEQGRSFSLSTFVQNAPQEWLHRSWRGRLDLALLLATEAVFTLTSGLIFLACVVGIPALILIPKWRHVLQDVSMPGLALCWTYYLGMSCMYALIHDEMRYSLPVQALAILSGVTVVFCLVRFCLAARHRRTGMYASSP